ncbi:MAG: hypothetical protein MJZ42_05155 [Bacteroidales bacterium]|nr:hypothetical protein [Bacteroidales bacterium]
MTYKRKIKFTTIGHKSRLTGDVPRYQGQIKHNLRLSREETLKGYAAYCREPEHLARLHLEALGGYIASELERGNRLNFGWFGVELRIGGGFKAANAPFTNGVNTLNVNLMPGSQLKKAVEELEPVNVTDETNWHISATVQDGNVVLEDKEETAYRRLAEIRHGGGARRAASPSANPSRGASTQQEMPLY